MSLYYRPRRLPANEDRIYKQIQIDNKLQEQLKGLREYNHIMNAADFAEKAEPKRRSREASEKFEALKTEKEHLMQSRRKKLAELLENEENSLQEELRHMTMTLMERRAFLDARARAIKEQRMRENEKFVEHQLVRSFKENSDEFRTLDSKMAVKRAVEARKKQQEQMECLRREQEEAERAFQKKLEKDWADEEAKFVQDDAKKAARTHEAMQILDEQRVVVEKLRAEEKEKYRCRMEELANRWKEEEDYLKKEQLRNQKIKLDRANEIVQQNLSYKAGKLARAAEEKREDVDRVNRNMQREAEEELAEKELRAAQKREAQEFAADLHKLMIKQKVDNSVADALLQTAADEEYAKLEATWKRQEEVRKRLYDCCHEERQFQLRQKERNRQLAEEEKIAEAKRLEAELRAVELERLRLAQDDKLSKQELLEALEAQIRCKQEAKMAVKEQKRIDFENSKAVEKAYEKKLEAVIGVLPYPEPNFGRKSVQWYD